MDEPQRPANGHGSGSYLRGDWPLSRAATYHAAECVGIRVEGEKVKPCCRRPGTIAAPSISWATTSDQQGGASCSRAP